MDDQTESKRTMTAFSASAFLNDVGADMVKPVWPFFVTEVIGASPGFLGFIDGLGDAFAALSQVFSGFLSDKLRKRRIFIWLGYGLSGIGRLGYFIARASWLLVPSKVLDRFGKMRDAPRDAYLAGMIKTEKRGVAFGVLRLFDNLGSIVGALLGLYLVSRLPIRSIMFIAAIPSFLAVIFILYFVRKELSDGTKHVFQGLRFTQFSGDLKMFFLSSGFFTLSAFSFSFLLLAGKRGGFEVLSAPVLFLVFTAVAALTTVSFGGLSDKIGRRNVLALSYFLWVLTLVGFLVFQSKPFVILLFALYGLHRASYEPVVKAYVTELAPADTRSSIIGAFQFVVGIIALPSSLIAGVLWDKLGFQSAFIFSLFFMILAFLTLLQIRSK